MKLGDVFCFSLFSVGFASWQPVYPLFFIFYLFLPHRKKGTLNSC